MIIIVDGYNLLKTLWTSDVVTPTQRSAFINLLGRYSDRRNHKINVIFDGGQNVIQPKTEKQRGVTVVYSGIYRTADELIIQLVEVHRTKEIVVVTADRGIINQLLGDNLLVLEPIVFYNKVKEVFETDYEIKDQGVLIKLSIEENPELDKLMQEAAFFKTVPKDQLEKEFASRKAKGNVASKEERTYHRKIKKL